MFIFVELFGPDIFLNKHSCQVIFVLMPVVVHKLLEKNWLVHKLVHLSLSIDLVVISDEEFLHIFIVCFRLVVLNEAEQAVRHDETIGQNHELGFARLDHFMAPTEVKRGKVTALYMLLEVILMHHLLGLQIDHSKLMISGHEFEISIIEHFNLL